MNIKRLDTVNVWFFFASILVFHLFLLTKIKFTAWPEMLLWPYLMLNGLFAYKDIAIAHTPLLLFELAIFFKLFGIGIIQLKLFTWTLIGITDLLVFLVAKRLYGKKVAIISALTFAITHTYFDGNGLWFDLFLAPMVLICFYLVRQKKFFGAGTIATLMILTKQTAFWFFIPLLAEIFTLNKDIRTAAINFAKGASLVLIIFIVIISLLGLLSDFWYWTVQFGIFTLPLSQGQMQLPSLRSLVVGFFPFTIFSLFIFKKIKHPKLLGLWMFAGLMSAYSRFEFFHFQPALPFFALGIGLILGRMRYSKNILIKMFLTLYGLSFLYLFSSYFIRNYNEGTRFYDGNVDRIAEYITANTNRSDKIFVMNWWDHIYVLTNTLPASRPWVPQLSWYQEIPGIQEEEVADLSVSRPKLIIFQDFSGFGLSSYVPDKVYDFVMTNYVVKEKIDNINILVLK